MRKLKESLAAKVVAVILLVVLCAASAASYFGVFAVWDGLGTANTFYEDELCQGPLLAALDEALWHTLDDEYPINDQFGGFTYEVWDGDPHTGALIGSRKVEGDTVWEWTRVWDSAPNGLVLRDNPNRTASWDLPQPTSGYYTVVGGLTDQLPGDSVFYWSKLVYDLLEPVKNVITPLAVLLTLAALLVLVFLLSAAGHKKGVEGITPNWQDKLPLDLYLAGTVALFFIFCAIVVEISYHLGPTISASIPALTGMGTGILLAGFTVLAVLMSLATRFKLGKWWRNSICYMVLRWCGRLVKKLWHGILDFFHLLPMTWRAVVLVGGALFVQFLLALLFYETWNGGFYFLLMLVFDSVLLATTAWATMQLRQLRDMGKRLAEGDLEAKVDTRKMYFDLKKHAEDLNAIGVGMTRAVEQRMRSERLKTELITNVSHDIKTPLTSIVNYVDLLQKEELPGQAAEYLSVLDRQSKRLKKLTEDLVEASKASTGNVAVSLEPIVVNEIVHQAIGDYDEKLTAGRLEVIVSTYEGNRRALADGRLLWRVLDNLLGNVCKYAMAGTRVYVDVVDREDTVLLSMKNISRDPLNVSADELTERFVRGDASRHTEGSGLGLNIAKSLMELMGGSCNVSTDGDLFKVELTLRVAE